MMTCHYIMTCHDTMRRDDWGSNWPLSGLERTQWDTNGARMEASGAQIEPHGVHMRPKWGPPAATRGPNEAQWGPLGRRWGQMKPKIVPESIPKSIHRCIQLLTSSECHSGTILEPKMALQTALIRNHLGLDTVATRDHAFFKTLRFPRGKQYLLRSGDVEIEYTSSGTC